MDQSQLHAFEARCVQDDPPPCQSMCPIHLDARAFAACMQEGRLAEARRILEKSMPLSGLLARLCHGPCQSHCFRAGVDAAVNLPLLERACVENSKAGRPFALPATNKHPGILGGGLSSLTAAWELARKGHAVTLFHSPEGPGAGLPGFLPRTALNEALEILISLGVTLAPLPPALPDFLQRLRDAFPALYIGQDDPELDPETLGLGPGDLRLNPITGETREAGIFAGGFAPGKNASFMDAAMAGKWAAGSVERFLQGVAPGTAREKDGPYPSRLHTSLDEAAPLPPVLPADALRPTPEEAGREAERCLRCQCLECVKKCVYLQSFGGHPKKYAREMYNTVVTVKGHRQANLLINSCARCGLCAAICPHGADMGEFSAQLRKELVNARYMPPSAHEFALEDMAFSTAPDVAFLRPQPGFAGSAWLFFPGCQLPASLPRETEAVYAHLCRHLPGGVGFFLSCCGAPARWAGQEKQTARTAASLRQQWRAAGEPSLILACASCLAFFRAELPLLPAVSLWETLAGLPLPENRADFTPALALHDPCAARGEAGTRAAVRALLARLDREAEELPLGGATTRCCGYGGLMDAANPPLGAAAARARTEDTDKTLLSYCSMCRDRLRATEALSLHLLTILFPGRTPLAEEALRPAPDISRRQEERLAFRTRLLQKIWKEEPRSPSRQERLMDNLLIADDVARRMDERRILRSDIALVLSREDTTLFTRPDNGRSLACCRPRQVTFWVEYSRCEDGTIRIHDAYCHRMVVPGVPDDPDGPISGLAHLPPAGERCCKDATGCGLQKKT
ncbi:MAG: 4Fe-4S dicluster domain-containing protein [Desulfovibrio sp.]|jgi:Fe-S oxidoreductase|nr:4Fe-4S dicluster domain-containing protein [Desulfovibrio sp.]